MEDTAVAAAGVAVAGEVAAVATEPAVKWLPVVPEVSVAVAEAAEADVVPPTKMPHPPILPVFTKKMLPPKNQLNGITTPMTTTTNPAMQPQQPPRLQPILANSECNTVYTTIVYQPFISIPVLDYIEDNF